MNRLKLSQILSITILLLTFNHVSVAQNQDWKLIKTKKKEDGWQIYKKKVAGSKLNRFKIVGNANCSIEEAQKIAWELITDPTMRMTKKGKSLGYVKVLEQSENEMVIYDFMKGSFLVKDRDVVVRYTKTKDTLKNTTGIKWSQIDMKGYEPIDSIIRMPIATGRWSFKKKDSTNCIATEEFQFYPGGNPPAWLINMVVKSSIPIELTHLRKSIKKN